MSEYAFVSNMVCLMIRRLCLYGHYYIHAEHERFDPSAHLSGVKYVFTALGSYRQLWDDIPCFLPWVWIATNFTYPVFH